MVSSGFLFRLNSDFPDETQITYPDTNRHWHLLGSGSARTLSGNIYESDQSLASDDFILVREDIRPLDLKLTYSGKIFHFEYGTGPDCASNSVCEVKTDHSYQDEADRIDQKVFQVGQYT